MPDKNRCGRNCSGLKFLDEMSPNLFIRHGGIRVFSNFHYSTTTGTLIEELVIEVHHAELCGPL